MQKRVLFALLGLVLILSEVHACGKSSDKGKGDGEDEEGVEDDTQNANDDNGNNGDDNGDNGDGDGRRGETETINEVDARGTTPLDRIGALIGDSEPYDGSAFDDKVGSDMPFVEDSLELDCNFDDGPCCWNNLDSDTSDWFVLEREPESGIWLDSVQSVTPPDGRYLVTGGRDDPDGVSLFASCPIKCSEGIVIVTLSHWTTDNIVLEVCTKPVDGDLENCQQLPRESPALVEFFADGEQNSEYHIVISASNFADDQYGDVAVIDDLFVEYETCPPNDDAIICPELPCQFTEAEECGWKDLSTIDISQEPYASLPGFADLDPSTLAVFGPYDNEVTIGNPITGIFAGDPGFSGAEFTAAILDREKTAGYLIFEVPEAIRSDQRQIYMEYFEATDSLVGAVCFDGITADNCREQDLQLVNDVTREWQNVTLPIKPGTKFIIVGARNREDNVDRAGGQGASVSIDAVIGVNEVQLQAVGDPTEDVCADFDTPIKIAGLKKPRAAKKK